MRTARALSPSAAKPSVSRVYNAEFDAYAVRVLPGDYYTTDARDEMIVTVLGSCVAACIRDPRTGYGGMNHFMLPTSDSGDWNGISSAMRYGNYAMEALINDILKSGCRREDLEIKLFGGSILSGGPTMVGLKNADFALRYLELEGLRVAGHDFGGPRGRRIHYFPSTGVVKRRLLQPTTEDRLVREESDYVASLKTETVEGDIELFD